MALPDFVIDRLRAPRGVLAPVTGLLLEGVQAPAVFAALGALHLRPGARVVELGYGGGLSLALMLRSVGANGQVFTIEPSPELQTIARRLFIVARMQGRLRLERGHVEALPLGTGIFDGALSLSTLAGCSDLDKAMTELARVLRIGGRLALTLPDPARVKQGGFAARGVRLIDPERFVDKLEGWGFDLLERRPLGELGTLVVGERRDEGQDD
ncbi:MAG: methyltransferase domain-containing protein [Myxococcales bacterium]|nr:methyltransferase domain-containing protein [Myxococcales bacterium]